MLKGIFYNSPHAACSIHSVGILTYQCLKLSSMYSLDYSEDNQINDGYDFVVYNQHFTVNNWMTCFDVQKFKGPVICIVTEVAYKKGFDPIHYSPKFFDAYIILDPTIIQTSNAWGFPRPIPSIVLKTLDPPPLDPPIVGSFGYATEGKNWASIVKAVEKDYDFATIRINIAHAKHVPNNEIRIALAFDQIRKAVTKNGIKLELTSIYMSDEELIHWCSQNTLNCFMYMRSHIYNCGLSAVTDQAIASRRPLLVTTDDTFRHLHSFIKQYPIIGVKEAIDTTGDGVNEMANQWSPFAFCAKFEMLLKTHINNKVKPNQLYETHGSKLI